MTVEFHGFKFPDNLRRGVSQFLAECDEVRLDPQLEGIARAATVVENGRVTLLLPPSFAQRAPEAKAESLAHEAFHVVMNHSGRRGDRDARAVDPMTGTVVSVWGLAIEGPVYHTGGAKVETYAKYGESCCTFEALGIPPCPPEVGYELLLKKLEGNGSMAVAGMGACGRDAMAKSDGTGASLARLAVMATLIIAADPELFAAALAGTESGGGRLVHDQAQMPPWIRRVLAFLTQLPQRSERRRSWHREPRLDVWAPGRRRSNAKGCVLFADASGSMSAEVLGQLQTGIGHTPELAHSWVRVFDVSYTEPIPVLDLAAVKAALESKGGGTAFQPVATVRPTDTSVVWITDGYSSDGWPRPHGATEVWVVAPGGQAPPPPATVLHWKEVD